MANNIFFWRGPNYGRMNDPANWASPFLGPRSAPGPGDAARISGGPVVAIGEAAGVFVTLNTGTLNLIGGSVGSVAVNAAQYSAELKASGTVNITGQVTVTGNTYVGSANSATDTLAINEATDAVFINQGTISVLGGSSVTETGGARSTLRNDGAIVTSGGSHITIGSDLNGVGTITDSAAVKGDGSLIEVGGSVGTGQSIALNSGTLQIDKPIQFHGVITNLGHTSTGANLEGGAIVLEHAHATMALLVNNELVLWGPSNFVADLHIKGASSASPLYATHEADGSLAITGYALPGATELRPSPMPIHLS